MGKLKNLLLGSLIVLGSSTLSDTIKPTYVHILLKGHLYTYDCSDFDSDGKLDEVAINYSIGDCVWFVYPEGRRTLTKKRDPEIYAQLEDVYQEWFQER